jgi:hypothetical protein
MPEQKELPISDLELVYLNGQEHGGAPVFKDVRLSRDSQTICEHLLQLAKDHDKRIRGESDCKRYIDIVGKLRGCVKQLKWLKNQERKPWNHILSQIDTGIVMIQNQLEIISEKLEHRLEDWRAEVEMGRAKQFEDSQRKAAELEQKAKYDSNPTQSRQAKVQAAEIRQDAKTFKTLKSVEGMSTVVIYEYEIENRLLAAKLPEEAVSMEPREKWFNEQIKQAKSAGQPLPTFPGIRVIVKTEVRLPR